MKEIPIRSVRKCIRSELLIIATIAVANCMYLIDLTAFDADHSIYLTDFGTHLLLRYVMGVQIAIFVVCSVSTKICSHENIVCTKSPMSRSWPL